jgi:hypothetical protein
MHVFLSGNSSAGRARPCQGRGREFESRFPLQIPRIRGTNYGFLV